MDQNPKPTSVLESLGEEIIRIITPVSICMFLVVILVTILNNDSSSSSITTIATIAYTEDSSDSIWAKLEGALLNSLVFVVVITVVTFIMVLLFYFRCTKFLKYYMGFSAFLVLGFMGGEIALFLIQDFNIPIDCFTFGLVLFNFTVVGVLAVFMSKMPIFLTQAYLVVIGMLVAYWFTLLPEWTTWVLLVALALYDLAAVLLPGGPLRLLVELAISRDEDIPALVYEARPVTYNDSVPEGGVIRRRVWRERNNISSEGNENVNSGSNSNLNADSGLNSSSTLGTFLGIGSGQNERNLVHAEEGQVSGGDSQLTAPLIERRINVQMHLPEDAVSTENLALEGIGLGTSGAIKLGLGDFIFYSVLVGRAAMYDFMAVYACYLAIVAGLGITLVLLAFYQKALPALPVSILLASFSGLEMASKCNRLINRTSISSLKSAIKSNLRTPSSPSIDRPPTSSTRLPLPSRSTSSPFRRFSSRTLAELGCVDSLLPLHSRVAAARMTSHLSSTSRNSRALSQGTLCRTSPDL